MRWIVMMIGMALPTIGFCFYTTVEYQACQHRAIDIGMASGNVAGDQVTYKTEDLTYIMQRKSD